MIRKATIMSMPVILKVVDPIEEATISAVFDHLRKMDERFSTFKPESEVSRFNHGELAMSDLSTLAKQIFDLGAKTKAETNGYFDIFRNGKLDPAGLVKGLAIFQGAQIIRSHGIANYYLEIAGDIEVGGRNEKGQKWQIGIKNPFDATEVVKVVALSDQGIATSGDYVYHDHIDNPIAPKSSNEIVSLTVIGPNVYEADRFATAAFAMGRAGLDFIEKQPNLEGYLIIKDKQAYTTSGFARYIYKGEKK